MNNTKKQIFISLVLVLIAAAAALIWLLSGKKTALGTQKAATPAAQEVQSPEEALARLLDEETRQKVLEQIQSGTVSSETYAIGMAHIFNKHNAQAIRENHEYKELLNKLWKQYHPDVQTTPNKETAQPEPQPQTQPQPAPELPRWENVPCTPAQLPGINTNGLSCKKGDAGFCAFFDNGRPAFCRTKDGLTEYALNKWGSSVTVLHKTEKNEPLLARYYADGKLARAIQHDEANDTVTTVWFNNDSLRMTQTDFSGKVLHKYYFYPGKPYIHYPDGNDMGETNGPWEEKDGQIFTDGRPLFTLPERTAAPDVCGIFSGACAQPQTQAGQELL